jgi:hypothetical protein
MKRSELEIGKVYAYSRTAEPKSVYEIDGFIVDSLEFAKDWRGKTIQEVKGRFTDKNGNPKESPATAPLRRLIGDYLPLKHDLELRAKNKEIARLNREIASTRVEGLINKHAEIIVERLKINRYDIRNNYDGRATITLTAEQLQTLVWEFQALTRHEEHAQRLETERLAKAYEESQEVVNA